MTRMDRFNEWFNDSKVGRYFHIGERKSTLITEWRAGTVTFLAVAYILSVNSNIIAQSGGTCSSADCTGPNKDFDCRYTDPGYQACVDEVRKDLITTTAASSLIGAFVMGAGANLPLAVCPGLGLNAYFTYTVVGVYGAGKVSYQEALAAIFIEGWIFLLLTVTGARQYLIKLLPQTLALAMSAGIGFFLTHIGLQGNQGIGVVTADPTTLVTLGGCSVEHRINPYFIAPDAIADICNATLGPVPNLPPAGGNWLCDGHKMLSATMWLGIAGFAIMCILVARGFKGGIIIGILFITIISWIPGSAVSYLGDTSNLPGGIGNTGPARWDYFKKVVAAPSLKAVGGKLSFSGAGKSDFWVALITFLYVDFFDATGTLFAMANFMNQFIPGFVRPDKNFPRSMIAYCSDGTAIIVGSLMGTSSLTAYIESGTGIREGGRTGITALVICCYFFISMFFAPILASIPVFATGPALILVGSLMMINVVRINWADVTEAIPAFLSIALMPLTYSIAYGVIGGIISYIIAHGCEWILDYLSDRTNGAFGHNAFRKPEALPLQPEDVIHGDQALVPPPKEAEFDDSVKNNSAFPNPKEEV